VLYDHLFENYGNNQKHKKDPEVILFHISFIVSACGMQCMALNGMCV